MTIINATDTSSTFCLIGLALSTSLLTLSAAEGDPATKEDPALGMTARLEQDFGHDSNPTQGDAHTQTRNHAEQADDYWRTIASLSLKGRDVPVAFKMSADALEYVHERAFSDDQVSGELSFPFHIGPDTVLAPLGSLAHEWLAHRDYSTITKAGLRWDQDWTKDWSTSVTPYIDHLRYAETSLGSDGNERGIDGSLTWWVPGEWLLGSASIDAGLSAYSASEDWEAYHSASLGLDLDWSLPWRLNLDTGVTWNPTTYDAIQPGRVKIRKDELVTWNVELYRPIWHWLSVTAGWESTNLNSNLVGDSYHQTKVWLGLIAKGF